MGLAARAAEYRIRLEKIKDSIQPRDFEWYPYDSLSNFEHLELLCEDLPALMGAGPVLDAGCGDGDISFFLESLGVTVHAIDHPGPNHSGMRGVRALKDALHSKVDIRAVDLDESFVLPAPRYRVVLLLGALYHLKNPFAVAEYLARHADYCVLSTRVARLLPDRRTSIRESPLAYLVSADELNADDSNFWIFSEAGLSRLLQRAQWSTVRWLTVGDKVSSDPVNPEHDERVFCLLRSRFGLMDVTLGEGWYDMEEDSGWRWTARRFRVSVEPPMVPRNLELRLYVVQAPMTLSARVNGIELEPQTFTESRRYTYRRALPKLDATRLDFEFELDRALPPQMADTRELGVIVAGFEVR